MPRVLQRVEKVLRRNKYIVQNEWGFPELPAHPVHPQGFLVQQQGLSQVGLPYINIKGPVKRDFSIQIAQLAVPGPVVSLTFISCALHISTYGALLGALCSQQQVTKTRKKRPEERLKLLFLIALDVVWTVLKYHACTHRVHNAHFVAKNMKIHM